MMQGPHKPFYNTKTCGEACASFKYFALQNTFCSCSNSEDYEQWGRAKDKECGSTSNHDPYSGRLGRNWYNAVYKTETSVATSLDQCEALAADRCKALDFKC